MIKKTATPSSSAIFDSYFRPKIIINLLCRYRIKCAQKARKKQLLRELTSNKDKLKELEYHDDFLDELSELLPPRRKWKRPKYIDRQTIKDSVKIAQQSIRNRIITTHRQIKAGYITEPIWYGNLTFFLKKIKARLENIDKFNFDSPRTIPIFKEKKEGVSICRPITIYNLEDRIIQSLISRYLLNEFDPVFHDSSLAFRPIKFVNDDAVFIKHHAAIDLIENYKKSTNCKTPWVTECDINKFFDCINHKVVMKVFLKHFHLLKEKGVPLDNRAIKIISEYLNSFSFTDDVLKLNKEVGYFEKFRIGKGKFDYPIEKLIRRYYHRDKKIKRKLGIPQGGAISCFIANLLLHEVDSKVLKTKEKDKLLYLRYCDDMMIFHPEEKECADALIRYVRASKKLKLLIHTPVKIKGYKTNDAKSSDFWKQKSKLPYKWGSPDRDLSFIPWIGFVGYQLKYNGNVRVRKQSLVKEIRKQNKLLKQTLRIIKPWDKVSFSRDSKKTSKQHIRTLESRFISMSVGKIDLYFIEKNKEYCWVNGFSKITSNTSTIYQLRNLDRNRNRRVHILRKKVTGLTKKIAIKNPKLNPKYFGAPFSYYNYLKFLSTSP